MSEKQENSSTHRYWIVAVILLLAAGLKLILELTNSLPFNSDEAVVGLMARHILVGEFPVFFYGQAYMGSLDALLVAVGFAIGGPEVVTIRIVQTLLYLGTIYTTILIADRIYPSSWVRYLAAILLAIPAVNTTLYTTVSLGGYGEALFIGNLLLIIALEIEKNSDRLVLYVLWGFAAGVGFWAFGLTLIYVIPSGVFILYSLSRVAAPKEIFSRAVLSMSGVLVGISPILAWIVSNDGSLLLRELLGSAIAGTSTSPYPLAVLERIRNFILFGPTVLFGARPPWDVSLLAVPLIPFIFLFWCGVFINTARELRVRDEQRPRKWMLLGVILVFLTGFILTPFGGDPSGRYFVPAAVPLAIFAAGFLVSIAQTHSRRWAIALLAFLLIANLWGTVQMALLNPPGITTQFDVVTRIDHSYDEELIEFLLRNGEERGFTNYWVAYPLAFKSGEKIIFIPALPYHQDFRYTERDNRYTPYTSSVASSEKVAYIVTFHPELEERIQDSFRELGITWQEAQIGDYKVFYDLSRVVTPEELGPGWLRDLEVE